MFGENVIVVSKTISVDTKRRIVLPYETGATLSDKIYFMHDIYRTKLALYSEKEAEEKLNSVLDNLELLKEQGKIDYKQYRQYLRYICGILCYPYESVDRNRRLLIPRNAVVTLGVTNNVFLIGNETHLELYKDVDTYEKLKRK